MKPLVEKVLRSGIVDRGMVELLEKWGNLPEGSSELLKSETLKNATKDHLQKFAEELAEEVATAHALKETNLDLDRLRWPVEVTILDAKQKVLAKSVAAVIDRMGRYFFRFQDVKADWFVPGYSLSKLVNGEWNDQVILQADVLFTGETAVAYQVTTSA